jgi:hypothetical protein
MAAPRSVPYQGAARAPFTGLRVVATRSVGFSMIAEASNRTPFAAMPAQPGSESAPPTHASARSAARRETEVAA